MNVKKASHIIKSKSFYSDGRLLKWIKSLENNGIESNVFILEDENKKHSFKYNGVEVETMSLFVRKFLKQRKGYFLKVPEYYFKSKKNINKSSADILVFHDVQQYLNIFVNILKSKKKIVWDLHELPHLFFLKFSLTRKFLRFLLENVDLVVYTNTVRRDYIFEKVKMREKKYFILNNYPNQDFIDKPYHSAPESLKSLRENKPYILWLGGGLKLRNFGVFLDSFEKVKEKFNLVILGSVDAIYEDKVNDYIDSNIAYKAFVRQEEMIAYIDNAAFSVVLYNSAIVNNFYCEPNRLYQLVTRGITSIVGNNPTMKNVIDQFQGGIVLLDDGSNVQTLISAINSLDTDVSLEVFKTNLQNPNIKKIINWDSQFNELAKLLKNLRN